MLLVALSGAAHAAEPISKTEIRADTDQQAKRRVMAQLSDLLIPSPFRGRPGYPPKRPLSDLWFYTRPRGTATRGVCVSDTVVIRFRPAEDGPCDADTPVAASAVESTSHYRLRGAVDPASLDKLDAAGQVQADRDCAAIDPRKTDFIGAPDEDTLVEGLWLLRQGQATPPAAMTCEGYKQPCAAVMAAIDPAKIESVDACPAADGSRCFEVEDGDTSATLRADGVGHLLSIKLGQEIVIADWRAD
ncbi:hypothetical protein HZF05_13295 [Sphingomonas sp. CGMCC 1.13654]|uniref:Uncharacterized protein n=1 Tax=Sphingomonas chungangi TaxID=2683589 RepID=A0A838L836_9SPHN|nr:hypothetical protein [Sphingomonas chungangi]MBA2935070.1 hypothetical protein [Sphingomonas chungangi]MVW54186.1 hypothetical protein [Sphingomonas chungangi]